MSKLIYLLGALLSALSIKGTPDAHASQSISQSNDQSVNAVYHLRTPEYLKNQCH